VLAPLSLVVALALTTLPGHASAQEAFTREGSPAVQLQFHDFYRMPIGPTGLEISEALTHSNGQIVRITGFMVQQEVPTPGRFLLTPQPVQMSQHADGEADDLPATTVLVKLDSTQQDWQVAHRRGLVTLEGVLNLGREEAAEGRVSWVRLQLPYDALRSMNTLELAGYLHSQQHRH
jgi:hypothetical protein